MSLSPGPWKWVEHTGCVVDANDYQVVEVLGDYDEDARLIAAAPELLAIVSRLLDHIGGTTPNNARRERDEAAARSLLKRIEGEPG